MLKNIVIFFVVCFGALSCLWFSDDNLSDKFQIDNVLTYCGKKIEGGISVTCSQPDFDAFNTKYQIVSAHVDYKGFSLCNYILAKKENGPFVSQSISPIREINERCGRIINFFTAFN